jgi:hypothetical protein
MHPTDRSRPEILGPTRDLLLSKSGKVVGAVKTPLKGIGNFVFGEDSQRGDTPENEIREHEEDVVRLANVEIERAQRAEREERARTLEMLVQMFPGITLL